MNINGSKYPIEMKSQLAVAIEVTENELNICIEESKKYNIQQQYNNENERFKPHLLVMCDKEIFYPIFVMACFYNGRFIYLKEDIINLDYIDMLEEISGIIKEHYMKCTGSFAGFGKINYYVLKRIYDEPDKEVLVFKPDGMLWVDRPENLSLYSTAKPKLTVGGKDITNFIKLD